MQQEIWFQKYKILGLLGRGGTAKVYLAEHIKLKSYRAIKCISKYHPLYDLQRNEAFILKNLKHSCIPIIYDIEEDEEGSYIVEQYLEGENLTDYIEARGILSEDIIIQYGIQLCDLIHYLHSIERPVLYVDLKPDNIIVSDGILKLIDFGSALYRDELLDGQDYTGTRGYAAPEIYNRQKIDERCDVYGIGMLLYYMATGILIKKGQTDINNIDQVGFCSNKLKNVINHCLKFHPSQRYASVLKLQKQLSAILQTNQSHIVTKQTIISIAGSQQRIGVTHFALRLCNYAISRRYRCLYQERNDSGCVHAMISRYEDVHDMTGVFHIEGILMEAYKKENLVEDYSDYQVVVQDFGCLSKDNLPAFLKADMKFLILGAKDWELGFAEDALNMVAEYKDVAYLFNFINGVQFLRVMKSMYHRSSYRIPYEPDAFAKITAKNGLELFQELMNLRGMRRHKLQTIFQERKRKGNETKTDAFSEVTRYRPGKG